MGEILNFDILNKTRDLELLKKVEPSKDILFIHCLGFKSFTDYAPFLKKMSGLEIKPESFKGAEHLFSWKKNILHYNHNNFDKLVNLSGGLGLQLQFHLPYRKIENRTLYASNPQDHDALTNVIEEYAQVIDHYNLQKPRGKVNLTMHPPEIIDHNNLNSLESALAITNEFYIKLGEKIVSEGWPVTIGLENMPDPKINNYLIDALGYTPEHFTKMLKDTNDSIQLTVDSGHRLINSNIRVRDLVTWCSDQNKYITNFHFHVNKGIDEERTKAGKSCDLHSLAVPNELHGFTMYILRAVTENIPLNLEIKAKKHSPEDLSFYVNGMLGSINDIYKEVRGQLS
jgi:hypothetical protein